MNDHTFSRFIGSLNCPFDKISLYPNKTWIVCVKTHVFEIYPKVEGCCVL